MLLLNNKNNSETKMELSSDQSWMISMMVIFGGPLLFICIAGSINFVFSNLRETMFCIAVGLVVFVLSRSVENEILKKGLNKLKAQPTWVVALILIAGFSLMGCFWYAR